MTQEELKKRTKKFAIDIIKLVEEFPNTKTGNTASGKTARQRNPQSTIRNPK
jgi:hypothetical protein